MRCDQFQEELLKYYLGEDDEKPKASEYIKMQSHLRDCKSCSKASEQLKGMQAALNAILRQTTSSTFIDGVIDKLPKPSPVTTYISQANKKLATVPRFVWWGITGLVLTIGIIYVWGILFPSCSLPIIYYDGTVDIRVNADTSGWKKLDKYLALRNGDRIKTDNSSGVIFVISKDTCVRMGENTQVVINYIGPLKNKGYDCRLTLEEGLIWISQMGYGNKESEQLKIETRNAIIRSSRGIFDVSFSDNNRTLLRVYDGSIDFSHQHFKEENTTVNKGYSSITSSDQPPTSPSLIDMTNLGGWEEWNLRKIPSDTDFLKIKPETFTEEMGKPKSWSQLYVTPPEKEEPSPSPTPGMLPD